MIEFQVLSHAGLAVRCNGVEVLVDPWLLGSCYWRSWWNYPPVSEELIASLRPQFVYLTHIHWDHYHGPSLRRLGKDVPIIIPQDRYSRAYDDLVRMGFSNIIQVKHGDSVQLGPDFRLFSYHFHPILDSAVVFEAAGTTLLNANDAKFVGAPLRQILRRHPRIDFAFRSHSSANARACYEYTDDQSRSMDEPDSYSQSFCNFMRRVNPRYAIPLASNHCHLHRETWRFNDIVNTPVQLAEHFRKQDMGGIQLQVMVSGDSWNSERGFQISGEDWFTDRGRRLEEYRERETQRLNASYEQEDRTAVNAAMVEKFFGGFLQGMPWFLRRGFRGRPIHICAFNGSGDTWFEVDVWKRQLRRIDTPTTPPDRVMRIAALVLNRAAALNMFGHVNISKRVRYQATSAEMPRLQRFVSMLNWYEYQVLPLPALLAPGTWRAYLRRWREFLVFFQVVVQRAMGRSLIQIETQLLRD